MSINTQSLKEMGLQMSWHKPQFIYLNLFQSSYLCWVFSHEYWLNQINWLQNLSDKWVSAAYQIQFKSFRTL